MMQVQDIAWGEMAEWPKAPLSKSGIPLKRDRGFESHSLRLSHITKRDRISFCWSLKNHLAGFGDKDDPGCWLLDAG